ncbi:MAG: glycogen synthase GlgA [Verrucomicrobia bacterium]|nr:MAG: glycogen synthase GlgA [Verrucomicrobiota bacterium]
MRILLASAEVHPFSKTGGLADMVGALGKALAKAGHHVEIVTPLYRGIRERFPQLTPKDWRFDLPMGNRRVAGGLYVAELAERLTVSFVDQPGYFNRSSIYQENGRDYADNAERFIFFSKAVVNLARYQLQPPEVVHIHDWHTALVPLLIQNQSRHDGWRHAPPTCLTIHNLAYQGLYPRDVFALTNLPANQFNHDGAEFFGQCNFLKAGLATADALTTVSPRYAREITTEALGHGLDGVLRKRHARLHGILNGVDYDEWNTTRNPHLKFSYDATDLSGKAANKEALQHELGLPVNAATPLFGTITRLADQKGIGILLGALEEMLPAGMQFVLLGSGAPHFERALRELAARFPDRVAVRLEFDQGLSHRIEAGSDFYLMPSVFEPCGLNQMYSLRYGTIPIVRMTGGLDDTVIDVAENPQRATGIKFQEYSVPALAKAIRKALVLFENKPLDAHYRRNGMAADFSWDATLTAYAKLYRELRGK